jgi:hypothetical protein
MKEDWPGDLCDVMDDTPQPKMPSPVKHELNYIEHDPDFVPRPSGAQTTDQAYDELVTAVTEMMNASPDLAKVQY